MYQQSPIDRRTLLADLGRGTVPIAVLSVAGCVPAGAGASRPSASGPGSPSSDPGQPTGSAAPPSASGAGGDITWERVNLGFVSAYILVRGGEAVVVDTGVGGSADAIETSLAGIGLDWSAVGHLILTHHHGDHIGSAADVLERATDAVGYAGQEDIGSISVPRPLTAVGDGEQVFGLTIVTTPGHTAGSISVLDPLGGLLVAGDALRTSAGAPALPSAQFTVDMAVAKQSIVKLGAMSFETLLVGHGEPIEGGASAAVAALGSAG